MLQEFNSRSKEGDHEFVDIHGRDIPSVVVPKTGEVAFPLSELCQTGVGIYQKSQYAKLSTDNKQFDEDFHTFMLESAKRYMLMNKIAFSEEQILKSIINCKNVLSGNKKQATSQKVFNDRIVEGKGDEIQISVANVSKPTKSPVSNPRRKTFPIKPLTIPKKITFKDPEPDPQIPNIRRRSTNQHTSENENAQPKQNDTPIRKLRTPKAKILEKAILDEHKQIEHEVLVTYIDKRNCIWVRDKSNTELFNTIHRMVNEEAEFQRAAPKPWQMEKVYMSSVEGSWFRCKINRFSPLQVFFLDYGNIEEVEELKMVSDELAKIPCMAVRLTFRENAYVPELEDEIRIKIVKQNEDGTYFVNVLGESQDNTSNSTEKTNESHTEFDDTPKTQETKAKFDSKPKSKETNTENLREDHAIAFPTFTKRPPRLCSLEDGQRVAVIHEERGVLYLRTKECHQKLKSITEDIEEEVQWAEPIERVDRNQLVLVRENDRYYRAAVLKVIKNKVHVEYLDYVKKTFVNLSDVLNISESLSREPVTYFQGHKLKDFDELDEESRTLIAEHIQKQTKFVVILNAEGDFDLSDGSQTLSQQLHGLESGPKKVFLRDMKHYEPKFGTDSYICGCYKDSTELTLVPGKELVNYADSVLIQEMEDTEPYVPAEKEVCFCFYIDHWYRCVVTRNLNKEFEVLLLDFGNVELVKKTDFRKPSEEMRQVPLLGLPCRLVELPDHPKLEDLLKRMVLDGEPYKVDVKSISDGKYDVEIPRIYEEIRKTLV